MFTLITDIFSHKKQYNSRTKNYNKDHQGRKTTSQVVFIIDHPYFIPVFLFESSSVNDSLIEINRIPGVSPRLFLE